MRRGNVGGVPEVAHFATPGASVFYSRVTVNALVQFKMFHLLRLLVENVCFATPNRLPVYCCRWIIFFHLPFKWHWICSKWVIKNHKRYFFSKNSYILMHWVCFLQRKNKSNVLYCWGRPIWVLIEVIACVACHCLKPNAVLSHLLPLYGLNDFRNLC